MEIINDFKTSGSPIAAGSSQTFEFYGIANLANTEVGLRSEIVTIKISG